MPRMSVHVQIRQSCARSFDAPGAVFGAAAPGSPPDYPEAGRANLSAPPGWIAEEPGQLLDFLTLRRNGYGGFARIGPEAPGRSPFSGLDAAPESRGLSPRPRPPPERCEPASERASRVRRFHRDGCASPDPRRRGLPALPDGAPLNG